MSRPKKFVPPSPPLIHDHFDGSAHCVDCGGGAPAFSIVECEQQEGTAARVATELARWICERYAMLGWKKLPHGEASTLRKAGVDPDRFYQRAIDTLPDHIKRRLS